jgi:DNA polymerase V
VLFSLIDCNNFYVSCERVFNPALEKKPVLVLSNNDGCVIARSNESKSLGIPMGVPVHQIKDIIERHQIICFSSNFALYGDLSNRVMHTIVDWLPDSEIYSVDEAFSRLDNMALKCPAQYCQDLRQAIYQHLGIPVSVGLAPTKVLAKLANYLAKKHTETGVFYLHKPEVIERALKHVAASDIWGVGKKLGERLKTLHIHSAWDLRCCDPHEARKHCNISLQKIILELRGESCLDLEKPAPPKSIRCSRSFREVVTSFTDLSEALSTYAANACSKARVHKLKPSVLTVFLNTNPFQKNKPQYSEASKLKLLVPSNDTREIISQATGLLREVFKKGVEYKKVGILLSHFEAQEGSQGDLFHFFDDEKSQLQMRTLDDINARFGKDALFIASQGGKKPWKIQRKQVSSRYTTHWDELVRVYCR